MVGRMDEGEDLQPKPHDAQMLARFLPCLCSSSLSIASYYGQEIVDNTSSLRCKNTFASSGRSGTIVVREVVRAVLGAHFVV